MLTKVLLIIAGIIIVAILVALIIGAVKDQRDRKERIAQLRKDHYLYSCYDTMRGWIVGFAFELYLRDMGATDIVIVHEDSRHRDCREGIVRCRIGAAHFDLEWHYIKDLSEDEKREVDAFLSENGIDDRLANHHPITPVTKYSYSVNTDAATKTITRFYVGGADGGRDNEETCNVRILEIGRQYNTLSLYPRFNRDAFDNWCNCTISAKRL